MRALSLVALLLVASPAAAATVSLTDTRTHSGVTAIRGWTQFGTSGPLQWTIPGLDPSDVGSVFTMTEVNASDFGFDWSFAEIFLSTAPPFTFNVGSYDKADDGVLHKTSQVFHEGGSLQEMRFEVLTWTPDTISVRGSVEFASNNVPEPSTLLLLSTSALGLCRRRCRAS